MSTLPPSLPESWNHSDLIGFALQGISATVHIYLIVFDDFRVFEGSASSNVAGVISHSYAAGDLACFAHYRGPHRRCQVGQQGACGIDAEENLIRGHLGTGHLLIIRSRCGAC